jgi:hypothetical protein
MDHLPKQRIAPLLELAGAGTRYISSLHAIQGKARKANRGIGKSELEAIYIL